MRLQQLPAHQGALWVRQGFLLFFKFPLAYSTLFASFLFGSLLLSSMPLIGPLLSLAALPLVTLGFMIATRNALETNISSTPMVFVLPLQAPSPQRRAIIQLGLAYAVATLVVVALALWVYGDSMGKFQSAMANKKSTQEELRALFFAPQMLWGTATLLGLAGLLSVPFWHAPALTHWEQQPWGKAMFFSWMACWRNKTAFLTYGLTWMAVLVLFMALSSLVLGLFGLSEAVMLAAVPAGLMFSTVFYASLYCTYADCFAADTPAQPQSINSFPGAPDA